MSPGGFVSTCPGGFISASLGGSASSRSLCPVEFACPGGSASTMSLCSGGLVRPGKSVGSGVSVCVVGPRQRERGNLVLKFRTWQIVIPRWEEISVWLDHPTLSATSRKVPFSPPSTAAASVRSPSALGSGLAAIRPAMCLFRDVLGEAHPIRPGLSAVLTGDLGCLDARLGGWCGRPDAATLVEAKRFRADVASAARRASGRPVVGVRCAALSEVVVVGSAVLKEFSATFAVHSEDGDFVRSPQMLSQ